ncbi:MAG: DUF2927 domain-containing protein [Alphaproteobacteria bacterium]|nr:DUF2927 domain-containing protein [Alphaproteobacteria bacterium]
MRWRRTAAILLVLAAAFAGGFVFVAASSGGVQARTAEEADKLTRFFDIVVFGNEIPGLAPAERVRKWTVPIRYKIAGTNVAEWRPVIQRHAATLTGLTGISYQEIGPKEAGENLVVMLVPRDKMAEAGALVEKDPAKLRAVLSQTRGGCYFLSYSKEDRIIYAAVVANVEGPKPMLEKCLLEELTQMMGLPNDSNQVSPSVFNDSERQMTLSPGDVAMVKALYDPALKPGTPRAEALAFVRKLFLQQP